MKIALVLSSLVCLLFVGCNAHDSGSGTEQLNGSCPSPAAELRGESSNGASCSSDEQCIPVCCTCSKNAAFSFLYASCNDGKCDTNESGCKSHETSTLCPAH